MECSDLKMKKAVLTASQLPSKPLSASYLVTGGVLRKYFPQAEFAVLFEIRPNF
jgi:hypothetical protein